MSSMITIPADYEVKQLPQVEIVANQSREVVSLNSITYVYIPMTENERRLFASQNTHACWRIRIDNQ